MNTYDNITYPNNYRYQRIETDATGQSLEDELNEWASKGFRVVSVTEHSARSIIFLEMKFTHV